MIFKYAMHQSRKAMMHAARHLRPSDPRMKPRLQRTVRLDSTQQLRSRVALNRIIGVIYIPPDALYKLLTIQVNSTQKIGRASACLPHPIRQFRCTLGTWKKPMKVQVHKQDSCSNNGNCHNIFLQTRQFGNRSFSNEE